MKKRCFFSLILFSLLTGFVVSGAGAEEGEAPDPMKLSAEDFMKIVRHAPGQETWARMEGTAMHKRDNARRIKAPIRLSIRFTPSRIVAQLKFNENELYNLGQSFEPPVSTQETNLAPGTESKLALYGIDIRDLTLGFLYKDVIREEKPDSVKTLSCRVFLLKGLSEGETARLFISTDYFFPLKVQWFKGDPAENEKMEPYRELEIASVQKAPDNDFYLIPKLEISGPTWRTMITFDERKAGYAKDGMPTDLFQE